MLSHVRHILQVIVQRVLSDTRVLIVLLLLQRVGHELFSMRRERVVKLLPHLVFLVGEAFGCPLLQNADLLLKIVDKLVNLIYSLLLGRPLSTVYDLAVRVLGLGIVLVSEVILNGGARIVKLRSDDDIFHLFLILTFIPGAFKRLLTYLINFVLHVLNNLTILLLSKDVVLLLRSLGLFQLFRLPVLLQEHLVVLFI